jgi:pimeloyl-ACP methyl ester carboxylesterase
VDGLKRFDKPTLILWAADDPHISPSWGRRLFDDIPGAERFELIPFCGHFWQEERPAEFAAHMGEFLARHAVPAADVEETDA